MQDISEVESSRICGIDSIHYKERKIEFNGGWDTQGLPVELQVEKELGVTGGKTEAINQFGIERIVSECKKSSRKI